MINATREIDKTHLSCDQAEERGFLHRDYIAHCLRWSHVVKHLGIKNQYKSAKILDIGCGKETPLIKTLYTMKMTPKIYVGVDYNRPTKQEIHDKIYDKMGGGNFDLIWNVDASETNRFRDLDFKPNMITCFEVLEHVIHEKVLGIIENIKLVASSDCVIFISTPCFNGKAAQNHINEMTYDFMETLMKEHFVILDRWGTFGSQKEIEPMIFTGEIEGVNLEQAYHELKRYYDSNLLSILFAPLFPKQSRNVLWKLTLPM